MSNNKYSKLEKFHEHVINGRTDEAAEVLKAYILETAASINQHLADQEEVVEYMDRDEGVDLAHDVKHDGIADDLNDIQSEEMYDDSDMKDEDGMCEVEDEDMSAEDADDDLVLDLSDETGEEEHGEEGEAEVHGEIEAEVEHIADVVDDIKDGFDELMAEFEKLNAEHDMGSEEEHDADADMSADGEEEPVALHGDEESEDGIGESIELHAVKANNKDMTAKASSAVGKPKAKIELGGHAVKTKSGDSAKLATDKAKAIPGGNTVADAGKALIKESKSVESSTKSLKDSIVKHGKNK